MSSLWRSEGAIRKPLTVTDPNGLTSTSTYAAATGNLLTSRVGTNASRTINYAYDSNKQLRRVTVPTGGADSIYYDGDLGNVRRTVSPRGVPVWSYKDLLGRDTLVVTTVDTIIGTNGKEIWQQFVYDSAGRVKESSSTGPSMPYTLLHPADDTVDAPAAEVVTSRTTYDAEGRALTIHTFSTPNPVVVQDTVPVLVETECEDHCTGVPWGTVGSFDVRSYDWMGRPLSQRLGSGPASVTYDPAGNVTSEVMRNGNALSSTYDAANRLLRKIVPTVTYGAQDCNGLEYGTLNGLPPTGQCLMKFPYYPTSGTSLVIPADTAHFVFNAAGMMIRADNGSAMVLRSYYTNGALATERQSIRSYATPSFATNEYTQTYKYDLGGRRIRHGLPFSNDSVTYSYSPETGALSDVRHGNDRARFFLDLAGREDSLEVLQGSTIGVIEKRTYDLDGQLTRLRRRRLEASAYVNLLDNTVTYDARGKVRRVEVSSGSLDVGQQTIRTHYSGLGTVVASTKEGQSATWETEEFRASATGTTYWSRTAKGSQPTRHAQRVRFGSKGQVTSKEALSPGTEPYYEDDFVNGYDLAGNMTRSSGTFQYQYGQGPTEARYYTATRLYHAADNRLIVSERYYATEAGRSGAWEEYRYDALGRRVLSRTRRGLDDAWVGLCGGTCHEWIERTIWDGDNALYEARVNATDASSSGAMDMLSSTGVAWGLVGYVHAGGYDRPIFTMDGRVPSYNWRGLPESSVWTNGAKADCSLGGPNCGITVAWPSENTIYMKPSPFVTGGGTAPQWIGSVLADGQGSTGMLYRRNRYYDPANGQFTQQDPIGIAGGANVYGFANGDPVNYQDPFGLCPIDKPLCSWIKATLVLAGTDLGMVAGGGAGLAGLAGGPAVAATVPLGAAVGAATGAAIGAVAGELMEALFFSGNSPEGAPGQTAGGRATDEHGNALGPSGKPQVNQVDHATRKAAKDAARQEGRGAPVNHPSPAKGEPHYHPTGTDGKKLPGSTHHNYPPG